MNKFLMTNLLLIISQLSFADQYSMRDCMILPISDPVGNSIGFKIYEDLERYLNQEKWCDYKSGSEVIEVFSRYRDKLPEYLNDEKVLKTVADRLKVGTIIRIKTSLEIDKMNLSLDIIGENGSDIYFSEKAVLNKIDILQANTTIRNWLELYASIIPYDGKVLGVLGDQITFSYAGSTKLALGQEFKVKRFIKKRRHPLLKKIVEWDTEVIAHGRIFNLSRGQALGTIKTYLSNKKLSTNDWIRLEPVNPKKILEDKNFSRYEKQSFGRLGDLSLSLSLSSNSATTTTTSGSNKMSGVIYGLSAELETWVTRNYVVLGEFSKKLGNLSKASGSPSSSTTGQNTTTIKIAGGYKYLPMGFFYGPQVNIYGGYAKYSYRLDTSRVDGFGENSFSGIMIGVGGSVPLRKGIRVFASGEIIPFGEFNDVSNVYGTNKSISSLALEVGGKFIYGPNLNLLGSFELINNSARFNGNNSELSYGDTSLKFGASFSF